MPLVCRKRVASLVALAIAAAGCGDVLEADKTDYAIINVETLRTGSTFAARATGLFFNAGGVFLGSSIVSRDSCSIQAYPPDITNPVLDYLDAGPGVVVKFTRPQTEGTLTPRTQSGVKSYVLPEGTSIPFVPGDTVTVEIPGATGGLTAITAIGRTAEAFIATSLTVPTSSETDMAVSWTANAAAVPGSAIFYSLRYSAPGTSSINREIRCFFIDDGNAVVPSAVLIDFRVATAREAVATRVRVTANRVARTVTQITSTFSNPVSFNPAP